MLGTYVFVVANSISSLRLLFIGRGMVFLLLLFLYFFSHEDIIFKVISYDQLKKILRIK